MRKGLFVDIRIRNVMSVKVMTSSKIQLFQTKEIKSFHN